MRRPPTVVIVILVWIVGGTVLGVLLWPVHSDALLPLRVTGRVVRADDGTPIPKAWVLALPDRTWAEDEGHCAETTAAARGWVDLQHDDHALPPGPRAAPTSAGGGTTDDHGAFDAYLIMAWGGTRYGLLGWGAQPTPQAGIRTLRIEIEGREPVILEAPHGTWTEHPDDDELWATYDLGVVVVPGRP